MPKEMSLSQRANMAMALTIGFYSMALIIGLGAVALPFIVTYVTGHVILKLYVICLVTGFTILAAMAPRADKFVPPGPLLTPTANPKLFAAITEIAQKTGQEMPDHVYLLHEFNAWVAQRGGANGFGGNRIMGLGLPLLKETNVSQFKAIIAHEFGHYHHGDTALGPRIYKIHAALERTIGNLRENNSIMQVPFKWYGNKFLKITSAISRSQEFGADRLAATIVGKDAMLGALEITVMQGLAYQAYWDNEFSPMLDEGLLPPLLEGYDIYTKSDAVRKYATDAMQEELKESVTGEFDSHPSIKERLNAITAIKCESKAIDPTPAITLIENPERLERSLLKEMIKFEYFKTLKPMSWDQDLAPIYIPKWKKDAEEHADLLKTVTPAKIPGLVKDPTEYIKMIFPVKNIPTEALPMIMHQLQYIISAGLALLLLGEGWDMHFKLDENLGLTKGDARCLPFELINDLDEGKITSEQWLAFCNTHGITDKPLSTGIEAQG